METVRGRSYRSAVLRDTTAQTVRGRSTDQLSVARDRGRFADQLSFHRDSQRTLCRSAVCPQRHDCRDSQRTLYRSVVHMQTVRGSSTDQLSVDMQGQSGGVGVGGHLPFSYRYRHMDSPINLLSAHANFSPCRHRLENKRG